MHAVSQRVRWQDDRRAQETVVDVRDKRRRGGAGVWTIRTPAELSLAQALVVRALVLRAIIRLCEARVKQSTAAAELATRDGA
jgi:6-phosphogluconate dehydrogenase